MFVAIMCNDKLNFKKNPCIVHPFFSLESSSDRDNRNLAFPSNADSLTFDLSLFMTLVF